MSGKRVQFPACLWSPDRATQTKLADAEQQLWAIIARSGPTPRIHAALIAALDHQPLTASIDSAPGREAHRVVRHLLDAAIDPELVAYVTLDSFRVASVIWEAYKEGFRDGLAKARASSHVLS